MAKDVEGAVNIKRTLRTLSALNDEIKLVLTGIIDFDTGEVRGDPQYDLEMARLIMRTARHFGKKTFVHCSGQKGLSIAAAAGVGSIEHGYFMSRSILETMLENGVAWTPTFCPVYYQWACAREIGWSQSVADNLRRMLDNHALHVRMAVELGVPLLLGTDAGSMGVPHGRAVYDEIEAYLRAGLSLDHTLKAATSAPRRYFEEPHPVLTSGARWEVSWLPQSPFLNLDALRNPIQAWAV
jgi:imidazolonepropionase-like amidohydrolase